MQLHRHHSKDLIFCVEELGKTAGIRDAGLLYKEASPAAALLYSKERQRDAFKDLKKSNEPFSPAKAFAKGFGTSFALPMALGLGMSGNLNPFKAEDLIRRMQDRKFASRGFQIANIPTKEADSLAVLLDSMTPKGASPELSAIKSNAEKLVMSDYLRGTNDFISKARKHKWQLSPNQPDEMKFIASKIGTVSKESGDEFVRGIQSIFKTDKKVAKDLFEKGVLAPTISNIAKSEFPGLGQIASRMGARDTFDKAVRLGQKAGIADDILTPAMQRKSYFKRLGRAVKSSGKASAALGILGGSFAIKKELAKRKKYRSLLQRSGGSR